MATLTVMTFNVRQADGNDGEHAWENRKRMLVEVVGEVMPTILGTQEAHPEQIDYILSELPQYAAVGHGRFGDGRDKHNKIFFLKDRIQLLDTGDLWFSETPQSPGTASWGIPRPRTVTWARIADEQGRILVLNTHLPYGRTADEARLCSARIVLDAMRQLSSELPVIVTGDFNCPPEDEIHRIFSAELSDAWLTAGERHEPESTVHGFGKFHGRRIDWIFYRLFDRPAFTAVITCKKNGLYPSDHYPVLTEFRWPVLRAMDGSAGR